MKVEVMIDRNKKLPDGAIPALENELVKRLTNNYPDCKLNIRRAGSDGLNILGADKSDEHNAFDLRSGCCGGK